MNILLLKTYKVKNVVLQYTKRRRVCWCGVRVFSFLVFSSTFLLCRLVVAFYFLTDIVVVTFVNFSCLFFARLCWYDIRCYFLYDYPQFIVVSASLRTRFAVFALNICDNPSLGRTSVSSTTKTNNIYLVLIYFGIYFRQAEVNLNEKIFQSIKLRFSGFDIF